MWPGETREQRPVVRLCGAPRPSGARCASYGACGRGRRKAPMRRADSGDDTGARQMTGRPCRAGPAARGVRARRRPRPLARARAPPLHRPSVARSHARHLRTTWGLRRSAGARLHEIGYLYIYRRDAKFFRSQIRGHKRHSTLERAKPKTPHDRNRYRWTLSREQQAHVVHAVTVRAHYRTSLSPYDFHRRARCPSA